jgi:uncharacterized protein YdaU (DUF1376 family)
MPVFVGDWDADTADLTCEEDGAYWRLVRHYWRRGAPPDDDHRLARIVGVSPTRWRSMRPALTVFFVIALGVWTHKRVERELVDAVSRKRAYVERAAKGGRAKAAKKAASSTTQALLEGVLKPCTSPSPSPEGNNGPSDNVIPLQGASADSLPVGDPRRAQAEAAEAAMTPEEKATMQAELRALAATMKTKRMPE